MTQRTETPAGPLRFCLAARRGDDHVLGRGATPLDVLAQSVKGRSVALVGNARALVGTDHGAAIDRADIVIRINRAPMPSAQSHGTRTDWLALATSLKRSQFARIAPSRLLWMSHKRKRLKRWMARGPAFTLFPKARHDALEKRLRSRPTTGALLIDWLAETQVAQLDLFGFDFMSSRSLSGHRDAAKVPHDFGAEEAWVMALIDADPRVTHHRME